MPESSEKETDISLEGILSKIQQYKFSNRSSSGPHGVTDKSEVTTELYLMTGEEKPRLIVFNGFVDPAYQGKRVKYYAKSCKTTNPAGQKTTVNEHTITQTISSEGLPNLVAETFRQWADYG